jgi:hypothetical protein
MSRAQAQGHESATQPALDNFVPAFDGGAGFVGSEEPPRRKQQQQQQSGSSRNVFGQVLQQQQQQPVQAFQQQQQQAAALGLQVMQQPQLMSPGTPEATAAEGGLGSRDLEAEEDDEDLLAVEEPPGLFDYEAGAWVWRGVRLWLSWGWSACECSCAPDARNMACCRRFNRLG